jgi:ABC-type polysaccharide/polyol phosphate export permease
MTTSATPATPPALVDVAARPRPLRRLADVWTYRELLGNLVRKELKVKYKNSALGFLWSLLNPALYLVVFYVVFELILKSGIPNFPIFLLAGLLPWNLFSTGLAAAATGVTSNGSLVSKVWFPREILPLAAIGAALVHYFLQTIVLVLALLVFTWSPAWTYLPLLPFALLAMLVFVSALGILLAAVNVYARDTQHLLELALLAWFWLTPIVYPYRQVADRLGGAAAVLLLNPMVTTVVTYQRAIYNKIYASPGNPILPSQDWFWYARNIGVTLAVSVVFLYVALRIFGRLEDNFAEEI